MNKPILFLNNAAQSESFTTTQGGGGGGINLPPRNRIAHASWLTQRFNEAWGKLDEQRQQRNAQSIPCRDGCYLEIIGQAGYELVANRLEDRKIKKSLGARLIAVCKNDSDETHAIIYIPFGQEHKFFKKISDYSDETKKTINGNPLNQALIESIEDIKLAILDKFWQDPIKDFPNDISKWCELWLRTEEGKSDEIVANTHEICHSLSIETNQERLDFPERTVIVIRANQVQLQELFEQSDHFAELRLAKEPVTFWSDMPNYEQTEAVADLLQRIVYQDKGVSVCILDSGINNGHHLLEPFCSDEEKETCNRKWSPADDRGHGTQMAGIALFGDLQKVLESRNSVVLNHRLFSGKILAPPNFPDNTPKLYGNTTKRTIRKCEKKNSDRTQHFCMAVTSNYETDFGRPSSWSAEIDKLCFGEGERFQRLILISAGNATNIILQQALIDYPEINKKLPIQNPAQAWNALTIGAFTEKTRITDSDYNEYTPLAQYGELSPHSTTSISWETKRWPNKPDIVLEGGNLAKSPTGKIEVHGDLDLLSTSHKPIKNQFELFNATSAATAKAAWMAAEIQSLLSDAWPETIKGLMIHSAEWSPQLITQFGNGLKRKEDVGSLLRIAGYGSPDLEKASFCALNHLTLIIQETIQPFKIEKSQSKTNVMHFYELPWPREALLDLGDQKVTLKITLSFFIEPSPGELQTQNRYTYASHGLRFDLNSPEEANDINSFRKRLNEKAREDKEDKPEYDGLGARWKIGPTYRNKGTVQSDSITLSGFEIADCYHIAVYPVGGWWKTRKSEKCMEKEARYSLIVSLHTEARDIDIYTPVANMISIPITI